MQFEINEIEAFFTTYGWRFSRENERTFRTGFVGDTGHFEISVLVTEPWIYFTINPFVRVGVGEEFDDEILELMLRTNHTMNLAKLALDDEGDILLTVELPRLGFSYSQFADALTALSHYADVYGSVFTELVAPAEEVEDDEEEPEP